MPKVLTAYGPQGYFQNHWNWCSPGELVGTHGRICNDAEIRCSICGCGVSFLGFESEAATSQAVVCMISSAKLTDSLDRFYKKLKQPELSYCTNHVKWLFVQLAKYPPGQILLVEKVPELRLIPTRKIPTLERENEYE